jgi:pimeloyl-ACP methyl ester carboxylesterase
LNRYNTFVGLFESSTIAAKGGIRHMEIYLKKCLTLITAAAAGVGLFFYTRYSRQEVRRLRSGARLVATRRGSVEVTERGHGDPVLVIQGSTGGYNLGLYLAWPDTGFHYIIPSRPGFLRTPLKNAVTPEAQSDLLAALLDTLNIQRAAVIALSGCGPQIFQLALRHPERISCLVLISVASLPIPLPVLILRIARALLRYSPFLPAIILRRPPENALISPGAKQQRVDHTASMNCAAVIRRIPGDTSPDGHVE